MKATQPVLATQQHIALNSGFLILVALLAMLAPGSARAQSFVFGKATLTTGSSPAAVAQGDFNSDGVPDFAVSNSSGTVSIFLSKPNGTYSAKTDYTVSAPGQIVTGDFNLDGKLDLAVATGSNLVVLLGAGGGVFQSPASQGIAASGLVAADFNGDGKLDLFVAGSASGLYIDNGNGTFTHSGPTFGSYSYINMADFNLDGKPDVLLSNATTGQVYLGNGAGVFTAAGTISGPGQMPAVADFNGDAKPDVAFAVTYCGHGVCHYYLYTYLGNADGTFTYSCTAALSATETQLIAADFNQDGKLDLATDGPGSTTLTFSIHLGNGDGTFQSAVSTYSNVYAYAIAAADVNLDGKLDVIFTAQNGASLVVYLGNGDGIFGSPIDYSGFTPGLVVADFSQDGKPDIALACPPSLCVLIGNGDGTFQAPTGAFADVDALSLTAGDFNNDGKTDLAMLIYPRVQLDTAALLQQRRRDLCAVVPAQ